MKNILALFKKTKDIKMTDEEKKSAWETISNRIADEQPQPTHISKVSVSTELHSSV